MNITIVSQHLTIQDVAIKYLGDVDGMQSILVLNPSLPGTTATLRAGDVLLLPDVINQEVVTGLQDCQVETQYERPRGLDFDKLDIDLIIS